MQFLTQWFRRHLSDSGVVFLALFLVIGFAVIIMMGDMLMPVLASAVIAYLLDGMVERLKSRGVPHIIAVLLVFCLFFLFVTVVIFGLVPIISRQGTQLFQQLPVMISKGQQVLMQLPDRYPDVITVVQLEEFTAVLSQRIAELGEAVVSISLSSVVGVITILVYAVLMPMLVFFFMKDKQLIMDWAMGFMPQDRKLATIVWKDVDIQVANYVRGKFIEIIVLWAVSFVTFKLFGLEYAMLLGVLVGLSVIIPYIGATVVTIPVLLIAWFQWGWGSDFIGLAVAYFIIQALDGNVLVPLLFSEVVNLHPIAIIVAILVFGGFWGFWGVFFAIPLATLVQAVISAWPKPVDQLE
ncbi:MAG: AI-2E family transporter [Candidatus Polarisedimenticolaceae bacterium]|nr:AI-2E family transporter [Candidatus Polarisedimenticolaceae bacterium]